MANQKHEADKHRRRRYKYEFNEIGCRLRSVMALFCSSFVSHAHDWCSRESSSIPCAAGARLTSVVCAFALQCVLYRSSEFAPALVFRPVARSLSVASPRSASLLLSLRALNDDAAVRAGAATRRHASRESTGRHVERSTIQPGRGEGGPPVPRRQLRRAEDAPEGGSVQFTRSGNRRRRRPAPLRMQRTNGFAATIV
jgi:hypothetical protein